MIEPPQQIGAFVVEESSIDEDGYWLGIKVTEEGAVPSGMTVKKIPQQTYATIVHKGPNTGIRQTYEGLHRWIKENGYERRKDLWHIEKYEGLGSADCLEVELFETIDY